MSEEKFHAYRGDVKAIANADGMLAFVTVHPEGRATAVYRVEPEKHTLFQEALPAGGTSLLALGDTLWIGGSDNRLYRQAIKGGAVAARGPFFRSPLVALAPLANDRLAVASGTTVTVLSRNDGKQLQVLELPDAVTALASDPTGQWLVAGTGRGVISVYESETDPHEFRLSDSAPLHEAKVTALLFEADELRFLSAGADQKLLSTHARGKLEAEDRGRGANHTEPITGMVEVQADRFLTGSTDATLKSWPRAKGARPVTQKDGVAKVVAVAVIPVHDQPQAVAACEDNTIRFFKLDDELKFEEAAIVFHGVADWAKNEFRASDAKRREAALRKLAEFDDLSSLERVADQMKSDNDHALRLLACQLLGESKHARAAKLIERGLNHKDEAVRLASFDGLRHHMGASDVYPMILALKTERPDVGQKAVQALAELAPKDDQALARLVETIDHKAPEVRRAVLAGLESVHDKKSPEASLTALASKHADLRRLALLRLFQRKLLPDARVQAALRWRGDDSDGEVRRVAFLLSLFTRDKLVKTLRERDAELNRQLTELETGTLPEMQGAATATAPPGAPPTNPGIAPITDPAELLPRLEELAQKGMLPPGAIEQFRQMLNNPATWSVVMNLLNARIDMLRRGINITPPPGTEGQS
jgi:ParB family chromosome partitioning protein